MKKGKIGKIISFLAAPRLAFIFLVWFLCLAAIGGSVAVIAVGYHGAGAYVMYGVAAVLLVYSIYLAVRVAPTLKARVNAALKKRNFTRKLTESYSYRTLVFSCVTFAVNAAYAAFNLVFAVLMRSVWYASLAGYYLILSLMRGGVMMDGRRAKRKCGGDEQLYYKLSVKNYRRCGATLFVLEVAMAAAVTLMVLSQKPSKYSEIMAIVIAAYTVYKLTLAIVNTVKARKMNDMQAQSFRNISLADAAISLLSLQTALVATFSDDGGSMLAMNAITGFVVCVFTICLGGYMVIKANRKLKELN